MYKSIIASALVAYSQSLNIQNSAIAWQYFDVEGKQYQWIHANKGGRLFGCINGPQDLCEFNFDTNTCQAVAGGKKCYYISQDPSTNTLAIGDTSRQVWYRENDQGNWINTNFPGQTCSIALGDGRILSRDCTTANVLWEYSKETGKWTKNTDISNHAGQVMDVQFKYDGTIYYINRQKQLWNVDTKAATFKPQMWHSGPLARVSHEVKDGLFVTLSDARHTGQNCDLNLGSLLWNLYPSNSMAHYTLGQLGMGRPVSTQAVDKKLKTPIWSGETIGNFRTSSNEFEWWDWFNGSIKESIDISIDFSTAQFKEASRSVLESRKVYNQNKNESLRVDFDTDLTVSCTLDQVANKLPSGVKTYANFPLIDQGGQLEDKGSRIADSNNGMTFAKSWDINAWAKVSMPEGYGIQLQLFAEAQTVQFNYNAVVNYLEDNTEQTKGTVTCTVERPNYSINYHIL